MKRLVLVFILVYFIFINIAFAVEVSDQDVLDINYLMSLNKWSEAEEHIDRLLNNKTFNKDSEGYCYLLHSLFSIKVATGDYTQAEELFTELSKAVIKVHGENSEQLILAYVSYLKLKLVMKDYSGFEIGLKKVESLIKKDTKYDPALLGKVYSIAANYYHERYNYDKSEIYADKSIEFFSVRDLMNNNYLIALYIKSDVYLKKGNYSEAEEIYSKMFEYVESYKETEPGLCSIIILTYIDLKRLKGEVKKAFEIYNKHKEYLDTYYNSNQDQKKNYYIILSNLYNDAFEYEKAEFYNKELLKLLGKDDYRYTAQVYKNLNQLYFIQGNMKLAEKCGILSLHAYNQMKYSDMQSMAIVLNSLGLIKLYQGDYKNAERYHKDAIKYLKKVTPDKESLVGQPYICNLARVYLFTGRCSEAEKLLDEYYDPEKDIKKDVNADILLEITTYANLRYYQGRYDESIKYFEFAITKETELAGKYTPDIGFMYIDYADVYLEMKDYEKAEGALKKTIKILLGAGLPDIALSTTYCRLARIYMERGNLAKAEELAKKALKWDKLR
ncbi:tetratricopeptide repeat protein, partial [Candidatus Dependentiae bacterium]|nr:tetratricopeptide repeat protein [Candidatus Dependentiae bacterium]